eukprot:2707454-Pleurochrysis_carterae.AAC.1
MCDEREQVRTFSQFNSVVATDNTGVQPHEEPSIRWMASFRAQVNCTTRARYASRLSEDKLRITLLRRRVHPAQ